MSPKSETASRRTFLGVLGAAVGGMGFLAGGSALAAPPASGEFHVSLVTLATGAAL